MAIMSLEKELKDGDLGKWSICKVVRKVNDYIIE